MDRTPRRRPGPHRGRRGRGLHHGAADRGGPPGRTPEPRTRAGDADESGSGCVAPAVPHRGPPKPAVTTSSDLAGGRTPGGVPSGGSWPIGCSTDPRGLGRRQRRGVPRLDRAARRPPGTPGLLDRPRPLRSGVRLRRRRPRPAVHGRRDGGPLRRQVPPRLQGLLHLEDERRHGRHRVRSPLRGAAPARGRRSSSSTGSTGCTPHGRPTGSRRSPSDARSASRPAGRTTTRWSRSAGCPVFRPGPWSASCRTPRTSERIRSSPTGASGRTPSAGCCGTARISMWPSSPSHRVWPRYVCGELIGQRPEWRATWWTGSGPWPPSRCNCGYGDPSGRSGGPTRVHRECHRCAVRTWASMSHLIDVEVWPAGIGPGTIAYFCGVSTLRWMTGPTAAGWRSEVRRRAADFIDRDLGTLLPGASGHRTVSAGTSSAAPSGGRWPDRSARSQYWRANVDPSDRYVQSLPGTDRYRLRSDESGYDNLFLAGDWTDSGINAGCIEAAVLSGLQAANAVRERPGTTASTATSCPEGWTGVARTVGDPRRGPDRRTTTVGSPTRPGRGRPPSARRRGW